MIRPAFTLLELLVVVFLLSLVAAVTIPTFQLLLSQAQLNTASQQVADLMRLQEQQTVTQQKIYGLTLVAGATSIPYFLCQNTNCTSKSSQSLSLPNNVRISSTSFGASDIDFSTTAAPNYSGTLILEDISRIKYRNIDLRPSGAVIDNSPEY